MHIAIMCPFLNVKAALLELCLIESAGDTSRNSDISQKKSSLDKDYGRVSIGAYTREVEEVTTIKVVDCGVGDTVGSPASVG